MPCAPAAGILQEWATPPTLTTFVNYILPSLIERPTGYQEKDVYVLQSRYNEADKEIKRVKGLKVRSHDKWEEIAWQDEGYWLA